MKISISKKDLKEYTFNQLEFFFPDKKKHDDSLVDKSFGDALERAEHSFSKVKNKYFFREGETTFNHLNGDQYSMFLYLLSNSLYRNEYEAGLTEKFFLLNKALFGIDVFYEVELPDIFLFVHPLGTVVGRGVFEDYLIIYQGCNIGANRGIYPKFGEHVTLHPNVSVLGNCNIGSFCEFGANSFIIDKDLPSNSRFIGTPKSHVIKENYNKNNIWTYEK